MPVQDGCAPQLETVVVLRPSCCADEIYAREGLTLDEEDIKAEVQVRIQQYKVCGVGGRAGRGCEGILHVHILPPSCSGVETAQARALHV
jgi:hypothetical protein